MVTVPLLQPSAIYFRSPFPSGRNCPICHETEEVSHSVDKEPAWTCSLGRSACERGAGRGWPGVVKGTQVAGAMESCEG